MNGRASFLLGISFNLFVAGNHVMRIIWKTQDAPWATLVESVCVCERVLVSVSDWGKGESGVVRDERRAVLGSYEV